MMGKPVPLRRLSVLVPIYNEGATVERLLRSVVAVRAGLELEVLACDDGSTDGTRDILRDLSLPGLRVIMLDRNVGRGGVLKHLWTVATGDVVIHQDADLEYTPEDYPAMLEPLREGTADVVYGSRFMGGKPHRILFFWHTIGNRLLTFLSNMCTNLNLTDMETCYKLFRTEIIQSLPLREKRFGFEPEVTARIAHLPKIRIYEVGISYYGRTYAEGKHIGWKDGVRAIYCIVKYNFFASDARVLTGAGPRRT